MNSEVRKACNRAYEERQKAKGIRIRSFRINDDEWKKVKEFIKQMRKGKKNEYVY